jgi:leucyl-tRNA synthetase
MKVKKFDHKIVEGKWRVYWEKNKHYSPDINISGKVFYNLWMFPYPSAEGLHAGHAFASTGSDVFGRFMRMSGFNVFQPIGYDSFGIHSENFALKTGVHPKSLIEKTVKRYGLQLRSVGLGYDWTKTVTTSDIDYYIWTQWLFLKLFKAGLVYRKKSFLNFCPSCKTVLADEQVMSPSQAGKDPKDKKGHKIKETIGMQVCERCGTLVEKKEMDQWHFRITDYSDRLLSGLEKIDWPEKIKTAQRNWIGKKEGINIKYPVVDKDGNVDNPGLTIACWTSRPDTNFGATFVVVSPEHHDVEKFITDEHKKQFLEYVNAYKSISKEDRIAQGREKTGVFTGSYALNELSGHKMPIWVADFVLTDVGTGAVVGVPGHDLRDFEFATKYGLEIKRVVIGEDGDATAIKEKEQVLEDGGKIINSEFLNGMDIHKATQKMIAYLEDKGMGSKKTYYHLRDWTISRQRYWGTPIPMIYCENCAKNEQGWFIKESGEKEISKKDFGSSVAETLRDNKLLRANQSDWEYNGWWPDENLPIKLPEITDFEPEGQGKGPLAKHPEFYKTKCPNCTADAVRETDVMDTFVDSSWYFLRYPSVGLKTAEKEPFDPEITKKWLPVDLYFGGAEHALLHLMYSRFVTMVLNDLGYLEFDEPFPKFYAHGLMIKDGAKMSKSRGNVVNPDKYIEKFGSDTMRLYLMFMGPMDGYPDFRDTGIEGMRKFVDRVWGLFENLEKIEVGGVPLKRSLEVKKHQTIKKVTEDIKAFKYNTAIASLMEYVNLLKNICEKRGSDLIKTGLQKSTPKKDPDWIDALRDLVLLLAPFTPHMSEEIYHTFFVQEGGKNKLKSVHFHPWPKYDPKLLADETKTIAVQVNGKLRDTLILDANIAVVKDEVESKARKSEKVAKWMVGENVTKVIFVPGKLINFVT